MASAEAICHLMVLEARSLKLRWEQAWFFSEGCEGEKLASLLVFSGFLANFGDPFLGLQNHHPSLSASSHDVFPVSVCVCIAKVSLFIMSLVILD